MGKKSSRKAIENLQSIAILFGLLILGLVFILASLLLNSHNEILVTMLRDVGFVFTPVAAISLIYRQFVEKPRSSELENIIEHKLQDTLELQFNRLVKPHERFKCYSNRAEINFHSFFSSAENCIDILVTNLQSLQMHLDLFAEMSQNGVKVRILAINPTHEFLKKRFNELSFKKIRHFREEMVTALRNVWSHIEKISNPASFEIRVYENTPTIMIFRCDNDLIISFILRQGRAREYLHIRFNSLGSQSLDETARCFVDHFEVLFSESQKIYFDDEDELVVVESNKIL